MNPSACVEPDELLIALAQNNVTPADHNNRAANHRARAGHIRKDQVTDQAGPENINILERRHGADDGDNVTLSKPSP